MPKKTKKPSKSRKPKKKKVRAKPSTTGRALTGRSAPTEMVARAATDEQLGDDQVLQILVDCVPAAGGTKDPIEMTKKLSDYGFVTKDQVSVLNTFVVGNQQLGVRRFGFKLSGDALSFAAPSTSMNDYAGTIQKKATKSA
jgi:hypothetical protein